ncbi:MAG: hypothetical protein LYZ70_01460 [Nitrososphaerales archaeon]|nr:hypothetical protein [Nitrososphaerales archaeon]
MAESPEFSGSPSALPHRFEQPSDDPPTLSIVSEFGGLPVLSPFDIQIAAGPGHIMEMAGGVGGIWRRQGSSATPVRNFTLSSFFRTGPVDDPGLLFDNSSRRWFATTQDYDNHGFALAVSSGEDPQLSPWTIYRFATPNGRSGDRPIMGISANKIVVSVNVPGVSFWIIDKNSLLTGGSANYSIHWRGDASLLRPVQSLGSTSTVYMVRTFFGATGTPDKIQVFSVTGLPPTPTITNQNITISDYRLPPYSAEQLGSNNVIHTTTAYLDDAVWFNGKLWLALLVGCRAQPNLSCVRLIEIDTTTYSVTQDFEIPSSAGRYYTFPAMRTNRFGDLIVVFGYSSPSEYPGLMIAAQTAGDPPGTLEGPVVLIAGTSPTCPGPFVNVTCGFRDYFWRGHRPIGSDAGVGRRGLWHNESVGNRHSCHRNQIYFEP